MHLNCYYRAAYRLIVELLCRSHLECYPPCCEISIDASCDLFLEYRGGHLIMLADFVCKACCIVLSNVGGFEIPKQSEFI